jgi:hypothetical protein
MEAVEIVGLRRVATTITAAMTANRIKAR